MLKTFIASNTKLEEDLTEASRSLALSLKKKKKAKRDNSHYSKNG